MNLISKMNLKKYLKVKFNFLINLDKKGDSVTNEDREIKEILKNISGYKYESKNKKKNNSVSNFIDIDIKQYFYTSNKK